jgi:hypothetical protein
VVTQEELDHAIASHGQWKTKLRQAIETGKLDTSVATLRVDDQCAFGKWLRTAKPTIAGKALSDHQTVMKLHAEFHRVAARVAELALGGNKAEAEAMITLGGEYSAVSSKLTRAMMGWKTSLV